MIGGHWTREQKAAYRAAFSIERIGDELWVLVGLAWFVVWGTVMAMAGLSGFVWILGFLSGFFALYWLSWQVVLPWLEQTMPAALREALPRNRFEGPSSPGAPRTYRELVRRWLLTKEVSK